MKKLITGFTILFLLVGCSNSTNAAKEPSSTSFSDVDSSFWAYKEIQELKGKGIAEALVNNEFAPEKAITRSKAARMMVKALDIESETYSDVSFSDLKKSHEDYKYIALAVNEGIFSGKEDGNFDPDGELTRAQMAKILTEALDLKNKGNHPFKDVSNDFWAEQYINALYSNGITTGSEGKYMPSDSVKRSQQAVFLYRAMELENDNDNEEQQQSEPTVPDESSNEIDSIANYIEENPDLFVEDIEPNDFFLDFPIVPLILTEGSEVVKENDMKFTEITRTLEVKSADYKNLKDDNFPQASVTTNLDGKSFIIRFDFRDEKGIEVAKSWCDLLLPDISLRGSIRAKVKEAVEYEQSGEFFMGNGEVITMGDYQIKYGVDSFLEFFDIEVTYIGK